MPIVGALLIAFGLVVGIALLVALIVALSRGFGAVFRFIGAVIAHVFRFVAGMLTDAVRLVGSLILLPFVVLLTVGSILIGRWSATTHYGRALQDELRSALLCLYRIGIGHPARLLLLTPITEKLERRLPEVVQGAPSRDVPRGGRAGAFPGYRVVGSLKGGGSGGKLYVAEPEPMKRAALERGGREPVDQVVIKSFSLKDGTGLDQIIRESTALENGKKLGLVLEHHRDSDRFYYVMPYVPGEPFGQLISRLHSESPPGGLDDARLMKGMSLVAALVETLDGYHRGGVWHKDVKPDNIIVNESGAHLVDFGLVTPLRSAMTLTTHGTEYFRDPELVRMALKGVKVHEVDGARFDTYAAGAVLYALIENSFPAHGGLSQVTKRCPPAAKWIVRRAMADYEKRYPTASAMLADLRAVLDADDPFAVTPAMLPSMRGEEAAPELPEAPIDPLELEVPLRVAHRRSPMPERGGEERPAEPRRAPDIRVTNWWTGGASAAVPAAGDAEPVRVPTGRPRVVEGSGSRPAREQLEHARGRARAARARAQARMRERGGRGYNASGWNTGVAVALFLFLGACVVLAGLLVYPAAQHRSAGDALRSAVAEAESAAQRAFGGSHSGPVAPRAPATPGNGFVVTGAVPGTPAVPAVGAGVPISPEERAALDAIHVDAGRVLVVSDVLEHARPMALVGMRDLATQLDGVGVTLIGDVPGRAAAIGPAMAGEELELVALARRARAQSVLGSDAAGEALRRFAILRDDVHAVAWIAPGVSGEASRAQVMVVGEDGAIAYEADSARAADAMLVGLAEVF